MMVRMLVFVRMVMLVQMRMVMVMRVAAAPGSTKRASSALPSPSSSDHSSYQPCMVFIWLKHVKIVG